MEDIHHRTGTAFLGATQRFLLQGCDPARLIPRGRVFINHLAVCRFEQTVWRDDAAMSAFAYRPGEHRERIERYKREQTCDRTSFTRLRAVRTSGTWEGRCPVAAAQAG